MPKLSDHPSRKAAKLCLLGDSGSGKTGALGSLAVAGRDLFIMDYDNGLDFLVHMLKKQKPEALAKINYFTFVDKLKSVGGMIIPDGVPKAFSAGTEFLTSGRLPNGENLGPIDTWPAERILVIDSGSFMAKAVMRWCEMLGISKDKRQVYQEAQHRFEMLIAMLYSTEVKCSVIITFHIDFIVADGFTKGYPATIGKALGPEIPKYFNAVLQCKTKGTGEQARRVISTVPEALVDLKIPLLPKECPAELPVETGLETYFKMILEA